MLDVPFQAALAGARWDKARKLWVHTAPALPAHLHPYRSLPYSLNRWIEDEINGAPGPADAGVAAMRPRQLQVDGARAVLAAANAGARGFLLTDDTGTGKTGTMWLAARAIASGRGLDRVLVLVDRPKQITIPHWRRSIAALGDGGLRVLVCSPDDLRKLMGANGQPRWKFNLVLCDESHLYRNVDTDRTRRFRRQARYLTPADRAPFVLFATATPGNAPFEMTYLAPLLAQIFGDTPGPWVEGFAEQLRDRGGIPVEKGRYGAWEWAPRAKASPQIQSAATAQIRSWLSDREPPLTLHRAAPWGPAPLELMPVALDADQQAAYHTAWAEFRSALAALAASRQVQQPSRLVKEGRAAVIRLRQKGSLLRAKMTAEWAATHVEAGRQVLVSCEFVDAAAEPIAAAVEQSGIGVARIYGATGLDKEAERVRFQQGEAQVVVFTATSSVSLHASEQMRDGNHATAAPRVGVMHNVRYSGLQGRQVLGRSHRDYQVCPWWLAYAADTVEEQIAQVMIDRFKSAADTAGADSSALTVVAQLLGLQWLPASVLSNQNGDD